MKPVLLLSSFAHYKTLSLRIVPDIYSLQGGLFIRGVVQWSTGHPNFLFGVGGTRKSPRRWLRLTLVAPAPRPAPRTPC